MAGEGALASSFLIYRFHPNGLSPRLAVAYHRRAALLKRGATMFRVLGRRTVAATGALVLVAAGIAALIPSSISADHIPANVSQHKEFTYASAGWRFDEPDGSFTYVGVDVIDVTVTARGGLRDRKFETCVTIGSLKVGASADPGDSVFRYLSGCQPLQRRQFNTATSLERGFVRINVPIRECVSTGNPRSETCAPGPTLEVNLDWEAGGPLIGGPYTGGSDVCRVRGRDLHRDHVVRGLVRSGETDYTSGQDGEGFMIDQVRRVRVVPEGAEDCTSVEP